MNALLVGGVAGIMLSVALVNADFTSSSQLHRAVSADSLQARLRLQGDTIRARVVDCATAYPNGDNGSGFAPAFPAAATARSVDVLTCPGAPVAQQALWSGGDGVFAPGPVTGFGGWQYVNDASGIRITLVAANPTDAAADRAMRRIVGAQPASAASWTAPTLTLWILRL